MATKKTQKTIENKKSKIKLNDMLPAELETMAKDLRKIIQAARLELVAGKSKNIRESYNLRKQLAKTLSVIKIKSHA